MEQRSQRSIKRRLYNSHYRREQRAFLAIEIWSMYCFASTMLCTFLNCFCPADFSSYLYTFHKKFNNPLIYKALLYSSWLIIMSSSSRGPPPQLYHDICCFIDQSYLPYTFQKYSLCLFHLCVLSVTVIVNIYIIFIICQAVSKHFTYTTSFDSHGNPLRNYYYPHFTDEEIEVLRS